jgi:hypothetical protein
VADEVAAFSAARDRLEAVPADSVLGVVGDAGHRLAAAAYRVAAVLDERVFAVTQPAH